MGRPCCCGDNPPPCPDCDNNCINHLKPYQYDFAFLVCNTNAAKDDEFELFLNDVSLGPLTELGEDQCKGKWFVTRDNLMDEIDDFIKKTECFDIITCCAINTTAVETVSKTPFFKLSIGSTAIEHSFLMKNTKINFNNNLGAYYTLLVTRGNAQLRTPENENVDDSITSICLIIQGSYGGDSGRDFYIYYTIGICPPPSRECDECLIDPNNPFQGTRPFNGLAYSVTDIKDVTCIWEYIDTHGDVYLRYTYDWQWAGLNHSGFIGDWQVEDLTEEFGFPFNVCVANPREYKVGGGILTTTIEYLKDYVYDRAFDGGVFHPILGGCGWRGPSAPWGPYATDEERERPWPFPDPGWQTEVRVSKWDFMLKVETNRWYSSPISILSLGIRFVGVSIMGGPFTPIMSQADSPFGNMCYPDTPCFPETRIDWRCGDRWDRPMRFQRLDKSKCAREIFPSNGYPPFVSLRRPIHSCAGFESPLWPGILGRPGFPDVDPNLYGKITVVSV